MLACVPLINTPAKAVAIAWTVELEFMLAKSTIATDAAVALDGAVMSVRLPDM